MGSASMFQSCLGVLYCGGNWSSNENFGLFYFNANNSSSNTNSNYGSRPFLWFAIFGADMPSAIPYFLIISQTI